MAAPWGRAGLRACALSHSRQVVRLASSCIGCSDAAFASPGDGPKQLLKSAEDGSDHDKTARVNDNQKRLARRDCGLALQRDGLADNDRCCFGSRNLLQTRSYFGQAVELRESVGQADSDVQNGNVRYGGESAIGAQRALTRRGRFEHGSSDRDDISSGADPNVENSQGIGPQQTAQKAFRESVPLPKFQAHLKDPKIPGWSQPLTNASFQSPVPDAFSVRAFLDTQHRVDWKTGMYAIQLAPKRDASERDQRSRREERSFVFGGSESSGFSGGGAAPLDRRKESPEVGLDRSKGKECPEGELESRERERVTLRELEREGATVEELGRCEREGATAKELERGERKGRSPEELERGYRKGRLVAEIDRDGSKRGSMEEVERGRRAARGGSHVGGPHIEDRLPSHRGAKAESGLGSGLRGEKVRLTSQADLDDNEFEEHSLDVLAQAEAEALLESLRALSSAAAAGEDLRSKVEQGLLDWSHVDKLCRTLLASEDPKDEELLFAGLRVACGMEMSVREMVKKWALVSFMIRRLVKSRRIAAAKRVPSMWSDGQATSRALARKVLTSALMKAGALRDAGEVFEASLAAGLLIRELTPVGKQLVSKFIHTKQFQPAMQLTLALGKAGEYAPFVEVIGALSDEQMFLEAFYILDVYSKAVEKADSKLLVKMATQYAEHGYEQTGLEFLAVLRKAGSVPHPALFKVLARAYTLAKLPALVEKVNEARGEADSRFPIALVNAYLDSGDVSKAGGLCAAAVAKGLTARDREIAQTLHRLLGAHAAAGNVPEGWEVLRWLDSRGFPYHIDLLTPLFEAVLRESGGDVTRLMDAFEAHRRHLAGRKAATWLHKSLFQFLTSKGLLEDAVAVFEAGVQDGVSVPLTNTIRLIFDLIEAGHATVALGVLRRAPEMEREYPKLFYKLTERLSERKEFLPFE